MFKINKNILTDDDIFLIENCYKNGIENNGDGINNTFKMNMFSKITCTGKEIFFCDLKNKNLLEIIKKYISLEKNEFIDSIHHIIYGIGEYTLPHYDSHPNNTFSSKTYLFLLSDNFEGGELFLNDSFTEFKKNDIIEFDTNVLHEVKPIKSGFRKILVIWIRKNKKLALI
jgi:hypothetical protein